GSTRRSSLSTMTFIAQNAHIARRAASTTASRACGPRDSGAMESARITREGRGLTMPRVSEREEADVETSSDAYARRFAGSVGRFFLDVQARTTLELLRPFPGASVLDVGGGHGQLALPLADAGYAVTVYGSREVCGDRVRDLVAGRRAAFRCGNLLG